MPEQRWRDESYSGEISARRKGRGQTPCKFRIGHIHHKQVVVRAIDEDEISPIVALMDATTARQFAKNLIESADALIDGQAISSS